MRYRRPAAGTPARISAANARAVHRRPTDLAGSYFSHFANGPGLTSWLGRCPANRVSGAKVLSVKTRKSRIEQPRPYAWPRSRSIVANLFSGTSIAGCAPNWVLPRQSKPRRSNWRESSMVTTGHLYDETICVQNEVQNRQRMEARLRKQARELGLQLVAI
jgi:hypothetical protein